MNNLWNQAREAWFFVENVIMGIWALLGGVADITEQQIRNLMRIGIRILIFELCLLAAGFIFNFQGAIVLAAIIAAIVWLIGFKVISLGVNATATTIAGIPLIGASLSTLTEPLFCEVRKLLPPFITIAMTFSFMAVVIAIRGVGYYGLSEIMIFTSLALFLAIFASYIGKTTKLPGWLMFDFVMYLFIGSYLLPVQVQGTMDWLEGWTIRRACAISQDGMRNELAVLPDNCPLYKYQFGQFEVNDRTSNSPTTVKIIGRKNDPNSKEGMLQVILPVYNGVYIGGRTCYVPARITQSLPKPPEPPEQEKKRDVDRFDQISLAKGDVNEYNLAPTDGSQWIDVPAGVNANIHPTNGVPYRLFFADGRTVDVTCGGKGIPRDYPSKFMIVNIGQQKETYVVSGL